MKTLWKALRIKDGKICSQYDWSEWGINKERRVDKPTESCVGLNASERVYDAMQYVEMVVIAKVKVSGRIIKSDNKWTCEKMTIIKAWKWEKQDSVALSIFCAELPLKYFEDKYPDDKRPRQAIEAAKKWLANPTEENRSARSAAESAVWSAESVALKKTESKIEKWIQNRIKGLQEIKQ